MRPREVAVAVIETASIKVAVGQEETIAAPHDLKGRFERGEIRVAALRVYNADRTWEDIVLGDDADVAAAIRKTMQAARPAYAAFASRSLHSYSHRSAACIVRVPHGAPSPGAVDASHMNGQGWSMQYGGIGLVRTRSLAPGELTRLRALYASRSERGGTWSWGDLFQSIAAGLEKVVQVALEVVDGAVHILIAGAEWVWNGIVKFAHQLYDVVETVFDWIGIDIRPLFRWLGFIFSWSDMLATRDALNVMLDQALVFSSGMAAYGVSRVDPLAAQLKARIGSAIDQLRPLGAVSLGDRYRLRSELPADFGRAMNQAQSDNVVGQALDEQLANPQARARVRLLHPVSGRVVAGAAGLRFASVADLEQAGQAFSQAPGIDGLGVTLKGEAPADDSNECSLLDAALDKLLDALQAVLRGTVDAGAAVAKAVLGALADVIAGFRDMLNYRLDIPVVTPLVEKIIGAPCTLMNVITLVLAIPVTIAYKVAEDHGWPDPAGAAGAPA